jgi:DNA-binding transcriptional MerR regulator
LKYSIGELSKITSLSIKSLRLYHEKEILVPAEVDQFTSYRYYSENDIEKAKSIKILKEYDFSLSEIKEMLDSCNDESEILDQLQTKLSEIKSKLERYNQISRSIESIINSERELKMNIENKFEVEEKEVETLLIAGHRMKGKYNEMGEGFKILGKEMGRQINGKAMALYFDSEYKESDADFEPCFPVRKGNSTDKISVRELKGGKCVSIIHKGTYESLGNSYKLLFDFVGKKNYKTILPSREVYIKGPGIIFKGNPNNYITEIQIFLQ